MPIPKGKRPPARVILGDVIFDRLLAEITTGARAPGTALSEKSVADQFGVSRTPVREALDRLTALGLVTAKAGRGSVTPIDENQVRQVLQTLEAIVRGALRIAVTATDARKRRGIAARLGAASTAPSAVELFGADGAFEYVLATLGNPRVRRAWDDLVPHTRRAFALSPGSVPDPMSRPDRDALRDAVERSDATAAVEALTTWWRNIPKPTPDAAPETSADAALVERTTLREYAFDTIYRAIYDGELHAGEDLNEDELASWLEMSRQPVRQALLRLADLDLVDLDLGRSATVARLTPAKSNVKLSFSYMLNSYAVEETAGSLSTMRRVELNDITARVEQAAASGDLAALTLAVSEFFKVFTESLQNPTFDAQARRIDSELAQLFSPSTSTVDLGALPAQLAAINDAEQHGRTAETLSLTHALYQPTVTNFIQQFRAVTLG